MGKSTYPATNNQEAVDLNILNANAFHMVLNGDVTTDVPTYEGNGTIPSVAKALHTMAAYKAPIPWEEGVSEADILQPRVFADNIFVPIRVPAVMDSIPSDLYWKLYFPTVGESLSDTGENYFREVLEETKSTFVVPFDIKTYLVGGVERPQVTVFVHKGNDVVEKIDVAELTYVDKNTFTLLNPATAGNIVEIYSTTIAAFTIVGAIRDDVYLAKDAVHADMLAAEQASVDAQDARDVAIAQRDVVITEGDTQVARVVSEGTQQVALATEQAVRAEAAASVAEEASSKAYAPQSIIKAALGPRPDGWTVADCDAPVLSMIGPSIVPHTGYVGPSGTASASSEEDNFYFAWKAFNGITTSDGLSCWLSAANTGTSTGSPAWLKYTFSVPRLLGDTVYLTARDFYTDVWNPKDFVIYGIRLDDSEDVLASFTNEPLATGGQRLTYSISPSAVPYKAVYVYITGSNGATFVAIEDLEFTFADAPAGHIGVIPGLQVAYAEEGRSQLSEELSSFHSVDLSAAADGTSYIYADLSEDGTFSGFGATTVAPEVGAEKADALADIFNPAEVVMYNVAGSPVRRVYIGTAAKSSGAITSVQGFALGDRVRLAATGTILDNPFGGWHVLAYQGTTVLNTSPTKISGVTINTTPVVVRR